MRKFLIRFLMVVFYTISHFITVLRAFLTSTVCHATFKKSSRSRALHSTCRPCHQNSHCLIHTCTKTNKPDKNLKVSMMGRRPDSTLDQRNIVIGMLTAGMMNKQITRHFQACECTISSLRTKIRQIGSIKYRGQHAVRPHKATRREDIDNVTSFRCNRFLSSAKILALVRNATGTQICHIAVPRRLSGARLK